jgi:hypothetical protein
MAIAIVLWVPSAAWILFAMSRVPTALALWPPYAVLVLVAGGALSTAVVVLEMIRGISLRLAGWSDERHFIWVGVTFVLLFIIQYTGVRVALSAHGS